MRAPLARRFSPAPLGHNTNTSSTDESERRLWTGYLQKQVRSVRLRLLGLLLLPAEQGEERRAEVKALQSLERLVALQLEEADDERGDERGAGEGGEETEQREEEVDALALASRISRLSSLVHLPSKATRVKTGQKQRAESRRLE